MKKITAILIIVLFCSSLAVFGTGQKEKAQDTVVLRFAWWGDEHRHNATLAAIEKFEAAHPGIKIEPEYQGWDGYHTKLKTQIAGNSAPDIMQTDVKEMPGIVSQGDVFYDISKLAINLNGFDMKFIENWGSVNGKIIGLPTGTNGQTSIFNATLMQKAGIPLDKPMTWNDIKTYGLKLKSSNPDSYMILLDPMQVAIHIVNDYISQRTGRGLFTDKNKRDFSEADLREVLTYINDLIVSGVMVPFEQSAIHNVNQMENPLWLNGKVVMYLNFTTHIASAQANSKGKFQVSTGLFPIMENAKQTGIIVQPAQLICINGKTKHAKEAALFVDYFFNNPDAQIALGLQRSVPAVDSARKLLESRGELDPVLNEAVNRSLANIGKPFNVIFYDAEIQDILISAVESVGYRVSTPAQAAAEAIKKLDAKLAEF